MNCSAWKKVPSSTTTVVDGTMVAPLSGSLAGVQRAHVTNGIRELILCKGADNKVGLRVKDINKGIFVSIVCKDSPAALGGLRFGDQVCAHFHITHTFDLLLSYTTRALQILQLNGTLVAGYSIDQLHKLIRKSASNNISVVVRDRPFERSITLHKNSHNLLGIQLNNGCISAIVKDSSAARNGVLTNHQLLEVNGQNVVGMKDKETNRLIDQAGQVVAITVVPTFIYDHMMTK